MMMMVVVGGGDGGDDVGDRIDTAGRAPWPRWCLFGPQGDDNPGHMVPMAMNKAPVARGPPLVSVPVPGTIFAAAADGRLLGLPRGAPAVWADPAKAAKVLKPHFPISWFSRVSSRAPLI